MLLSSDGNPWQHIFNFFALQILEEYYIIFERQESGA